MKIKKGCSPMRTAFFIDHKDLGFGYSSIKNNF